MYTLCCNFVKSKKKKNTVKIITTELHCSNAFINVFMSIDLV